MFMTIPGIVRRVPFPRRALLLLLLVATPALAGCNVKDWYNQQGWVDVQLVPQGPRNTSLDEFQRISVAIFGVTVRQLDVVQPKTFQFQDAAGAPQPLLVDLVSKGKEGESIPLARFKTNMRPTSEVTIRMQVVEAIDASGQAMQVCRIGDTVRKWPCFFVPTNDAYTYDEKPFAPPRGGEVLVGFPAAVKFVRPPNASPGDARSQYFIETDPALIQLTNR